MFNAPRTGKRRGQGGAEKNKRKDNRTQIKTDKDKIQKLKAKGKRFLPLRKTGDSGEKQKKIISHRLTLMTIND